ncbi:unnamed protein product [Miscanthus lutarioriparius]|uniref:Uncharacterized protein n=1 Tax=Miscanthus lutarioriparius TaxID=422564 RepID=A0A811MD20_9POAL|nr:unnamed protein product [Miscanthus lutarioriparius]
MKGSSIAFQQYFLPSSLLTHSFGERRPVAAETGGSNDAGSARRRLGRKGFVHFAGRASVDGIAGVRTTWSDGSSDDPSSTKAGDEEDQVGDEDDDAADGDVDDADDGLAVAADEEDDGIDFQSQDGSREDDPNDVHGGSQNGLNISVVATVNGTGTVQDGAAVLVRNATGGEADGNGTVPTLSGSGSALNNVSSVDLESLRDRGTAGDVANKLLANQNGTDNSGRGISS